jgi:hypothetical protein
VQHGQQKKKKKETEPFQSDLRGFRFPPSGTLSSCSSAAGYDAPSAFMAGGEEEIALPCVDDDDDDDNDGGGGGGGCVGQAIRLEYDDDDDDDDDDGGGGGEQAQGAGRQASGRKVPKQQQQQHQKKKEKMAKAKAKGAGSCGAYSCRVTSPLSTYAVSIGVAGADGGGGGCGGGGGGGGGILDLEDIVAAGEVLGACPYYALRRAVPSADLILMPYASLVSKATRLSLGITVKGKVVVIDEAHNLIDTVASSHSCTATLAELADAESQLQVGLLCYSLSLYIVQLQVGLRLWDVAGGCALSASEQTPSSPPPHSPPLFPPHCRPHCLLVLLQAYLVHYKARLGEHSATCLQRVIQCARRYRTALERPKASDLRTCAHMPAAAPSRAAAAAGSSGGLLGTVPHRSLVKAVSVNAFLSDTGTGHIDLFSLTRFVESSDVLRCVH